LHAAFQFLFAFGVLWARRMRESFNEKGNRVVVSAAPTLKGLAGQLA